jgi:flagellar biosynthesis protein FlhF
MLLKSRRTPRGSRRLGAYEVVFGLAASARRGKEESQGIWDVADFAAAPPQAANASNEPVRSELHQKLTEFGFDDRVAAEFVERVEARLLSAGLSVSAEGGTAQAHAGEARQRAIDQELMQYFPRDSSLGPEAGVAVVALVGPPGSGKTSTAVRLAVSRGLAQGRRVVLLAANDHRPGGSEKLRHFAAMLGVDFRVLAKPDELPDQVAGCSSGDLVFIDTPGYGPKDIERARALAGFLAERADVQKHLVLPATLSATDLRSVVQRFEIFAPDKLLLTRLDETGCLGPVFGEAAASRRPLSFVTTGQQVPGDLTPAEEYSLLAPIEKLERSMRTAA